MTVTRYAAIASAATAALYCTFVAGMQAATGAAAFVAFDLGLAGFNLLLLALNLGLLEGVHARRGRR